MTSFKINQGKKIPTSISSRKGFNIENNVSTCNETCNVSTCKEKQRTINLNGVRVKVPLWSREMESFSCHLKVRNLQKIAADITATQLCMTFRVQKLSQQLNKTHIYPNICHIFQKEKKKKGFLPPLCLLSISLVHFMFSRT